MNKIYVFLLAFLTIVSCKTKMNQYVKDENKVNKRHGKWKEEYSSNDGTMAAVGRYRKGEKIGVWKTYMDNQLFQRDKYGRKMTKTKTYYQNGKLMEQGQSRLDISKDERHWYYFGDWKYYDENGNLKYIKKYTDGKKIDSIAFSK
jgi:antitoxin component YwqK of YwqJK toxin-antitoxin module